MDIVAAEEIEAVELVAGDEALNLVEQRERIEGAELRLEAVGREPDGVAVGFARSARRATGRDRPVTPRAEGNQRFDVGAHAAGEANEDFEVGFDAGAVGGLATICTSPKVLVTVPDFS